MANTNYYDRAAPYSYYDHPARHELRQEYGGRVPTHTPIQEPEESLTAGGQARRRIAVAVSTSLVFGHVGLTNSDLVFSVHDADDVKSSARGIQGMGQGVKDVEAQERGLKSAVSTG